MLGGRQGAEGKRSRFLVGVRVVRDEVAVQSYLVVEQRFVLIVSRPLVHRSHGPEEMDKGAADVGPLRCKR